MQVNHLDEKLGTFYVGNLIDDTELNLSSATSRNEMSDLEEMGYIVQPHTSAGRIPSDKGYRLYVDHLIAVSYTHLDVYTRQVLKSMKHNLRSHTIYAHAYHMRGICMVRASIYRYSFNALH